MREMKDSGLGYLGIIPANWRIERIKNHLRFSPEKNPGDATILSLYREHGIVPKDSRDDNHNVTSEDTSNYRYVRVGDFVVNKMKAWQGSMAVSDYEGAVSPAYYVYQFTSDDFDKKYLHYLLRSKCYAEEFRRLSGGIRIGQWDLPKSGFETTCVAVPPKEEQIMIVTAIDAQLYKVDTLISNVQAQIEKLKAYKQSVITEVVIKGLDPTVPMKDSELLWFGNIPQHWELAKVKMFASTCSGGTPPSGDMSYYDGDVNWVCSYDLHEREITETGKTLSEKGAALIAGELQSPNSILIAMYGGSGTIGNSGLLKCYARTNQAICSVHFDEAVLDPRFAFYQTMFIRKYWMYYAVGTRKDPNISQDVVRNMKYVIPPMEEQLEIVKLLDEKCSQIDRLITIKQEKIEKLEQYKRSLIYEYVTGKKAVV